MLLTLDTEITSPAASLLLKLEDSYPLLLMVMIDIDLLRKVRQSGFLVSSI
jgi:hypothetical protein